MPELPEVETIVKSLTPIIGQKIIGISTSGKKFRITPPHNFKELLIDQEITHISRRAKYLLIGLQNEHVLVLHLGMSGKVLYNSNLPPSPHDHLNIKLSDNNQLVFNDARRFGLYTVIKESELPSHSLFKNLGVEPLTEELNSEYLHNIFQSKAAPIKSVLMDAAVVVGVGNIYASESLFEAKILPTRTTKSLSKTEIKRLCAAIKKVLEEAIKSGGSTLRDYVRSTGEIGYFQHKFQVYGKKGNKCSSCETAIDAVRIAGRSTFYCIKCQK